VATRSTPRPSSLISILATALVAFALVLVSCSGGGSSPAESLEPGPSTVETTEATPTDEPTVAPTQEPTPEPLAQWTGLTWSDPVTPPFVIHLHDLLPWGDGYVAVGTVETESGPAARILTSPDGLNWTVTFDPGYDHHPQDLAVLGDELLAFSQRTMPVLEPGTAVGAPPDTFIWRSTDGEHWSEPQDWPTWSSEFPLPAEWDEQHPIGTGLVDVASGADGLLAIGNSFIDGVMAPVIQHSRDGRSWTAAALPAESDSALLNALVEHDGRFVITGAVGVGADPAAATAAAWHSDDGLTWVRATVEPDEFGLTAGAEFGPLWAADEGLLTCRGNREMAAGGWRYMDGWLSSDGTSWRYSPQPGPHPACDWSASDGTRIVSLGPRDHASPMPWPGVTVASVSTDGVTWQSLELTSTLTDRLERFWVVPDGVIYAGVQSFWFGTAQVAE
jgi:hypothetical protein